MKKSSLKTSILLLSLASLLWLAGSWWHYACNIKNTCGNDIKIAATKQNSIDTDGDGLSDAEEARLGTDPLLVDTDKDSISDSEEVGVNLDSPSDSDKDNLIDALDPDDDNDGLLTNIEEKVGTSSLHADTDEDGILDQVEIGENPDAPLDTDGDGIINALDTDDDDDSIDTIEEAVLGTNHLLVDTDGDGLSDSKEIAGQMVKPLDTDKDGIVDALDTDEKLDQDKDGLPDLLEVKLLTDPKKADSDGDGINDAIEIGDNPNEPKDTDLDGIIDALDAVDDSDSDNDGLTDTLELKLKSNPKLADSDEDGINDIEELGNNKDTPLDTDQDGIFNLIDTDDDNDNLSTRYEIRIGTNPLDRDSDKDSLLDNIEVKAPDSDALQDTDADELINPIDDDDDNDTIPTVTEISIGTDPLKIDSDGDGISDAIEIGSNLKSPMDSDGDGLIDALDTSDQKTVASIDPAIIEDTKKVENEKSVSLELTDTTKIESIQSSILFFPFLSANPVVKGDALTYLDEVSSWMKNSPKNQITLSGHTDNVGSKQSNLALGIRRVMVIRELLINRGAPMEQIDIMSLGESKPLKSNSTKEGRLKNRRVEITPIKLDK